MGCLFNKDKPIDELFNPVLLHDRRVQLFDLLRFLRAYFHRSHAVICAMENLINAFHEVIHEHPIYLSQDKKMFFIDLDRDALFHVAGELAQIKQWINLYTTHLSKCYIELLKTIYYKDYRYFLETSD